ncbi:Glycosyltransferase Gtf1 [Streptococcus parauberis]|uniref:glycosyltransferase n=1 Tax=Streptococcus parauberis TaxID=1348 RepID=UPI000CCE1005|nr:glycosyltransferase [Streptococcus parauberis]PNY22330.1 Glycosyltransferase Gtf1 [Streptococcus parauberis]
MLSVYFSYLEDASLIPQLSFDEIKPGYPDIVNMEETSFYGGVKTFQSKLMDHFGISFTFTDEESDIVDFVSVYAQGKLIRRDYFTNRKMYSKFYYPQINESELIAVPFKTNFYDNKGKVIYEEIVTSDEPRYVFANHQKDIYKSEFVETFIKNLNWGKNDTVIFDRSADQYFAQVALKNKGQAKLVAVIHSEHYFPKDYDPSYLYLNYEYYYIIRNVNSIDTFIVSTDLQKQKFTETVYKESGVRPNVQVIPVGSVDLKEPSHHQRKHFSMMTASRLQARKRVDWLIRAAILAKKDIPQLEFSIYGRGSEQEKLENIINEHNAQNYIFLKGHADLDDVYPQYELYVSASSWETFGLSLLEAVSHGLAMIGLNVPYGNPTFIESDSNGFLVDYEYLSDEQITIQALADKIITYFKLPETVRQSFNDKSFEIAEQFTKDKVKQVWLELLEN